MKYIYWLALFLIIIINVTFSQRDNFERFETKNFIIKYKKGISKASAQSVANDLELHYKEWSRRLKLIPTVHIEARIYKTERKYFTESRSRLKEETTYSNGIIHICPPDLLDKKGNRANAISRALALRLLGISNDNGCPLWLSEAYGIYAGGDLEKYGTPPMFRGTGLSDFQQEMNQAKREKDLVYFYSKLSEVMKFMLNRYSKQKVDSLFTRFDGIKSLEQVFEETFGEKYGKIEMAWNEAVKNRKSKR